MLEKSPAQPDQHDLPQYVGNLVQRPGLGAGIVPHTGEEGRIGVGSRAERAEPPEEHQPADDRAAVAADAVEDGHRQPGGPVTHHQMRGARTTAWFVASHNTPDFTLNVHTTTR